MDPKNIRIKRPEELISESGDTFDVKHATALRLAGVIGEAGMISYGILIRDPNNLEDIIDVNVCVRPDGIVDMYYTKGCEEVWNKSKPNLWQRLCMLLFW